MIDFQFLKNELTSRSLTVATAESVTVGRLQTLLATPSGASDYFVGGMTAYNIDRKVGQLGVDREHAAACDCVSQQVAHEMALGALRQFEAKLGLATTGYAEPYPEQAVETPFAFIAVASAAGDAHYQRVTAPTAVDSREDVQQHFAVAAVHLLLEFLDAD